MLWLKLFGGATLERERVPVRSRATHRRRLALLALLASARGRLVGREKVVALLWPEHTSDAGRRLLSEALYVLRRELGESVIRAAGDEIGLEPDALGVDLWAFEDAIAAHDLAAAVELHRGPFLDGFFVSDAPEFERWSEEERARHTRRYHGLLAQLAEECEARGAFVAAVEWWRLLALHDPLSSRTAIRLMRALTAAGERGAAIRHADAHVALLRAEIGAAPDPDIVRLADRLRREPLPGVTAAAPPEAVPASPPPPPGEPAIAPPVESPSESAIAPPVAPPVASPPSDAIAALPTPSPVAVEPRSAPRPSYARRPLLVGALLLVGVLLLAALMRDARRPRPTEASPPPLDPRRVAVLYLDDHSPGKRLDYLADGLTEALIQALSEVDSLDVISRNGVKPFRDRAVPLDSIVRTLRAGSIIEGSVQESDRRLRVTIQLVDGATGSHLQSRTLERPLGELFELEDELTTEVAGFLRRRLGQEVRTRRQAEGTRSAHARELLLRAQRLREEALSAIGQASPLDVGVSARMLGAADSLFLAAAAADPAWPAPEIGRGWVALQRAELAAAADRARLFALARAHAERALQLRPESAEALELRGTAAWREVHLGAADSTSARDSLLLSAGRRDLEAALGIDPTLARAWGTLSQLLRLQGKLPESDVAARRALEEDEYLDDAPVIIERLYRSAYALGRWPEASSWCERGYRQYPDDWRFTECRLILLGAGSTDRGDVARGWRLVDELRQLDPDEKARAAGRPYSAFFRQMAMARVLARAGLQDSARAVVARVRTAVAPDRELRLSFAYDDAYVSLLLGEKEAAIRQLAAYADGQPHLRQYLSRDIQFRALWDDPRFRAISRAASTGGP